MQTRTNKTNQGVEIEVMRASEDGMSAPAIPKVHVSETVPAVNTSAEIKIDVRHADFFYGARQALYDVSLPMLEGQVTALIGPSGCGKTTFLRTLNRMNDLIPGTRIQGEAI